ncbi:MAG: hypothetical protein QF483_04345 [Gammaproteobacteria bacterium]|jgi:hypothetical protein|nr:hypothetical protein [Gammaproteobacteria bacterium]MDP7296070.1 hypothetical protein [Gammaproteobacteria bacterium]MDP7419094.1 hypothetical protein [Gammaproteobacteria bacterium]MDP7660500.1 hypothetical protein [Gammaproteobacteria bacterium]HJP39078.1 hypothetical protein [Gammaproteobacteria bacterium]
MEIIVSSFAAVVAASCFVTLLFNDLKDTKLKDRQLVAGQDELPE